MPTLIQHPASGTSDPDASDLAPDGPSWKRRRDESGLTTLEWLLIVAAVAGIAALAVVLVTNVVDDTSEQISGSSARQTSLILAADEITQDAAAATQSAATNEAQNEFKDIADWKAHYDRKCNRLQITYGDVGDDVVEPVFKYTATSTAWASGTISNLAGYTSSPTGNSPSGTAIFGICKATT